MITFVLAVIVLIGAYFTYGKFIEKIFGADKNRPTPACSKEDGVDYVPMSNLRVRY